MRNVYAVGESLLDIISKNGNVITEKVGGSMLNASVSLARIELLTFLISEIGSDDAAKKIESFLASVGVDSTYIYKFTEGNTAIARASLDEKNNAKYIFEKNYPVQRLKVKVPKFSFEDLFLFGSIYAIDDAIYPVLKELLLAAHKAHSLIFYDPNIRKVNLTFFDENKILRNLRFADIIRGSNEDFENVFGVNTFENACLCIPDLDSKIFIYTCADDGIYLSTPRHKKFFDSPKIEPISTIGAGDSFNAGLIYAFHIYNVDRSNLLGIKNETWGEIMNHAIRFATDVCMSFDNYISEEFAKKVLSDKGT